MAVLNSDGEPKVKLVEELGGGKLKAVCEFGSNAPDLTWAFSINSMAFCSTISCIKFINIHLQHSLFTLEEMFKRSPSFSMASSMLGPSISNTYKTKLIV